MSDEEMIYTCNCLGRHVEGCPLHVRLKIKYALIEKYKASIKGHIVPEWIEREVDEKVKQHQIKKEALMKS